MSDELGFQGAATGPLIVIRLQQGDGTQSAQGWSMGGPVRESGSLPPGQGSKGHEGSWSMGWVQGNGSAKAPFPGLDEVVSMKWSGVSGAGTPLCRWVQGERSLPRVMERRYVPLAPQRAQCPGGATGRGDATGARSGPPCQDGFVLQNTSCDLRRTRSSSATTYVCMFVLQACCAALGAWNPGGICG